MTKDECMAAMNKAFGAPVVAGAQSWDFMVETTPVKFVTLLKTFVDANIEKEGMTKEEFLNILSAPDRRHWATLPNGVINLVLR